MPLTFPEGSNPSLTDSLFSERESRKTHNDTHNAGTEIANALANSQRVGDLKCDRAVASQT